MAGKTVGELQIELKMDGDTLSASMNNVEKKLQKNGTTSGGKFGNAFTVAAGNLLSKGISKISGMITSHIGDAIARIDTLNNFPKVMSNLGISTDKADQAIKKLSDNLQGVPTNLDDAASAVQRFTSKNGDVSKSADLFLSLNNAILAGGQSAELQSSALEQISQAYAKGKPDMMEWRTIQQAMPAQLNQISKKILGTKDSFDRYYARIQEYVDKNPMSQLGAEALEQFEAIAKGGGDMSTALGSALRAGIVPMDDFMNTIVEMNKVGVEGFPSLEEQMRNSTGGIQTSINIMNSRITQGIGKMIEEIGPERIADGILAVGNALKEVLVKNSERIKAIMPLVKDLLKWVLDNLPTLLPVLTALAVGLKAFGFISKIIGPIGKLLGKGGILAKAFGSGGFLATVFGGIKTALVWLFSTALPAIASFITGTLLPAIGSLFTFILANPIVLVIAAVVGALVWVFTHFEQVKKIVGVVITAIGKFFAKLFEFFSGIAEWVWTNVLQPIVDFVWNCIIAIVAIVATILEALWKLLAPIAQWIWDNVLQPVLNFLMGIWLKIAELAVSLWNKIVEIVTGIWQGVVGILSGVAQWISDNVVMPVVQFFTWLWEQIVGGVTAAIDKVKQVFDVVKNWINQHIVQPIAGFFEKLWEGIKTGVNGIKAIFKNVFSVIVGIVRTPINGIIKGINAVIDMINGMKVPDWVPGIGGMSPNFKKIPELAQGGLVSGRTTAVIGEAGREAVLPLDRNTDNWSGLLASALADEFDARGGGGGGITIEKQIFDISNEMDADDIGRKVMNSLRRAA